MSPSSSEENSPAPSDSAGGKIVCLYVYVTGSREQRGKWGKLWVGGGGANKRFHCGYMRNLGSHAEEAADRNTRSESETAGKCASLCVASADSRFNFLLSDK